MVPQASKVRSKPGRPYWNDLASGTSLSGTGWHHVMYTFDDANDRHRLYIDGELAASASTTDSVYWTGATTTYVGQHPVNGNDLNGTADDVRIYDRALSPEEVAALAADKIEVSDSIAVTVANVNDAPTIMNLGGDTLLYVEGDGQQAIDQGGDALVNDVDSGDFDSGTLTIALVAGGNSAEDVLSIVHTGAGVGQIGVSGTNVSYEGTIIGTFTGGVGGTDLVISLNASADETSTSALVRAISYENIDTVNPTSAARAVRFLLADGDGATSAGVRRDGKRVWCQ